VKRLWFYLAVIGLPIASVAVLAAIVLAYRREIRFPDLTAQIIASFFGAFFAYLFLRAADIIDKRAEIERKNLAALGQNS
jgi:hypothetical protein